ncbi:nucleotidyl transferase AbiEii/AbiGii toxin family protein [Candidatus Chloroploca mongolica]|nr:nucleotidyl transferase AbiEii/AbiGii toxin family protein [Candidatus Chloroploca mongolica]
MDIPFSGKPLLLEAPRGAMLPQPLAGDTPAHLEAGVIATLRTLTPVRKLELARAMNQMADRLALAGIQQRMPEVTMHEWAYALALQRLTLERRPYGAAVLEGIPLMPTPVDPLALALRLGALLDAQAIPYVIVGSMAAVVHGEYRTTRDIDVVVNLSAQNVRVFVEGLREDFTFLLSDITDALLRLPEARDDGQQRASFCAYDKTTGFQLDVYLFSGRPFEVAQFQRAQVVNIAGEPGGALRVASAEDTVLAKLEWYSLAPSDRQWRDVQAILRVQDDALDQAYLLQWADALGFAELLTWALRGQQPPLAGDEPRQQRLF